MFDRELVIAILRQIDQAIDTIKFRTRTLQSPDDFTDTPAGREKLDSVCMLFMAIESPEPSEVRRLGFLAGEIEVPDDFDRMGEEDIARLFGMGDDSTA